MMNLLAMQVDLNTMGETSLVMFLAVFVSVTIWALSRSNQEIKNWGELPLGQESKNDEFRD